MKISEASKILLDGITPFFEEYGFKLNKNNCEFKRTINNCTQKFRLLFYREGNYLAIEPQVSIKIAAIESIYKEASTTEGRPYHTLGNHLFEILRYIDENEEIGKGSSGDWLVENKIHLEELKKVIPEYIEETVLPYFEDNSSIERVDKLLNKYPRELSIHNYIYPLRANIAIIAAKLNNNPQYEKLIEIYEEELEEAEETYKEEFKKLKELLEDYTN